MGNGVRLDSITVAEVFEGIPMSAVGKEAYTPIRDIAAASRKTPASEGVTPGAIYESFAINSEGKVFWIAGISIEPSFSFEDVIIGAFEGRHPEFAAALRRW